jgi:hypothetical protein
MDTHAYVRVRQQTSPPAVCRQGTPLPQGEKLQSAAARTEFVPLGKPECKCIYTCPSSDGASELSRWEWLHRNSRTATIRARPSISLRALSRVTSTIAIFRCALHALRQSIHLKCERFHATRPPVCLSDLCVGPGKRSTSIS